MAADSNKLTTDSGMLAIVPKQAHEIFLFFIRTVPIEIPLKNIIVMTITLANNKNFIFK